MIQPLWRTVWRFLKKLKIEVPYDPAIPLLGIYPEKTIIQKDACGTSLVAQWSQCKGHGFDPWSRKIPHATEQLSLCTTTTEPALKIPRATTIEPTHLGPVLCNKRSHLSEKPVHHNEE